MGVIVSILESIRLEQEGNWWKLNENDKQTRDSSIKCVKSDFGNRLPQY
jgi:hypothetical protein